MTAAQHSPERRNVTSLPFETKAGPNLQRLHRWETHWCTGAGSGVHTVGARGYWGDQAEAQSSAVLSVSCLTSDPSPFITYIPGGPSRSEVNAIC